MTKHYKKSAFPKSELEALLEKNLLQRREYLDEDDDIEEIMIEYDKDADDNQPILLSAFIEKQKKEKKPKEPIATQTESKTKPKIEKPKTIPEVEALLKLSHENLVLAQNLKQTILGIQTTHSADEMTEKFNKNIGEIEELEDKIYALEIQHNKILLSEAQEAKFDRTLINTNNIITSLEKYTREEPEKVATLEEEPEEEYIEKPQFHPEDTTEEEYPEPIFHPETTNAHPLALVEALLKTNQDWQTVINHSHITLSQLERAFRVFEEMSKSQSTESNYVTQLSQSISLNKLIEVINTMQNASELTNFLSALHPDLSFAIVSRVSDVIDPNTLATAIYNLPKNKREALIHHREEPHIIRDTHDLVKNLQSLSSEQERIEMLRNTDAMNRLHVHINFISTPNKLRGFEKGISMLMSEREPIVQFNQEENFTKTRQGLTHREILAFDIASITQDLTDTIEKEKCIHLIASIVRKDPFISELHLSLGSHSPKEIQILAAALKTRVDHDYPPLVLDLSNSDHSTLQSLNEFILSINKQIETVGFRPVIKIALPQSQKLELQTEIEQRLINLNPTHLEKCQNTLSTYEAIKDLHMNIIFDSSTERFFKDLRSFIHTKTQKQAAKPTTWKRPPPLQIDTTEQTPSPTSVSSRQSSFNYQSTERGTPASTSRQGFFSTRKSSTPTPEPPHKIPPLKKQK